MDGNRYDLVVIGSGPSGQKAAIQGAKLGKRVAVVERRRVVGGVCIHTGTIPSKTLREAVLYLTGFSLHGIYGVSYAVKKEIRVEDLAVRVRHVIQRETDVILNQMQRNGVEVIYGEASFAGPREIAVESGQGRLSLAADRAIVAVGTEPSPPDSVRCDDRTVIDSDGILRIRELPRTMTVVGGGVIGLEYASILSALGIRITLLDQRDRLLEFVDQEIVESLSYQLRQRGVTIRLGEAVRRVVCEDGGAVAELASGKKVRSETILYSVGRTGATATLNLAAAGLSADARGRIAVDGHFRTAVPHIYAVGDVIGFPSLASTSMEQGRLAAAHAFGLPVRPMSALYPYGIYSVPEISMVGPTEEELTRKSVPYETGISRYREIARGQILGDDTGVLKLLFHRDTRKLLAAHAIGTGATELIHIAHAAVSLGGTLDYFLESVFNYPTLAECYKVAALDCANRLG